MARLTPRRVLFPLVAVALLRAGLLGGCDNVGPAGASFKAVDITGADYAQTLNLPDADGRMRSLADFKGKVAVVFFGFTQCPDVCPTTLAELAAVKQSLGAAGADVQPLPRRPAEPIPRAAAGEETAATCRCCREWPPHCPPRTVPVRRAAARGG